VELRHRDVLEMVGRLVRERRRRLGLTVKEVASASGLSERFMVSLEGGKSNVSVASLLDLAVALDVSLLDLLPKEPLKKGEKPTSGNVISLIGLRGAGKSTLGAAASLALHVPFVELDARIAERAGMSAGEIFDLHGAQYYRRLERETLEVVLASGPLIVATAGSLVTDHTTFEKLRARSTVIWVKASAEDHYGRVIAQGDLRPIANRRDAMAELRGILRARRALYERAHHTIDTSRLGLDRALAKLVEFASPVLSPRAAAEG
jgi:XRE family transcriptional regulator, aerobic/anaerobic benzoate catabolism transcriptional regulator